MGKTNENYVKIALEKYSTILKKYCLLSITEISDIKSPQSLSAEKLREAEAEKFHPYFKENSMVYLLDENGKMRSSVKFAQELKKKIDLGSGRFIFAIGGSYGFSEAIKSRYERLSFGPMTMNHQLVRVVLAEQLFRCMSIIHGSGYHHE
jgi:23S rRNA (pseudouridine1915-N3)-methyltransferase